jgi:thiol:disulfide interchange protein DsbD
MATPFSDTRFLHPGFAAILRRRAMQSLLLAGLALGMLLLSALQARAQSGEDYARQAGAKLVGRTIPALRLTTVDGQVLDLGTLRGRKAVYLKFWATWCVPCREQMPHFEKMQRSAGEDLLVVAINIGFDETLAQIHAYRRAHGLTMPIVHDVSGRLGELFGLRVTPQHVVIGKDGRIDYVGHLADAALDSALAAARSGRTAPAARLADPVPMARAEALQTGDAVPALRVPTLAGGQEPLSDPEQRRPTVLAFLSPWCESYFKKTRPQSSRQCRALREELVALGKDPRLRWLGIASGIWASEADLKEYRDEHGIAVPLSLDRESALFRRFGVQRVPAAILVSADGRIERRLEPDGGDTFNLKTLLQSMPDAAGSAEPLPVDSAFKMSARLLPDGVIAIDWAMPPGYYLYRDRFSLTAARGSEALGPPQWSAGVLHQDPQFGKATVFYDRAQLRVPLRKSASLPERIQLQVTFQGCLENSLCYPPTRRSVSLEAPASLRVDAGFPAQWLVVLGMAFLGGLILNLMPCVLPVLSLKVLSVLQAREDAPGAKRRALAYTAGVLLSFTALGAIVLALRASGVEAGWGVQMQHPWIVALLGFVMVALGLGLSGVVHFGAGLGGVGARAMMRGGLQGDFMAGVLACVVASPCMAPFMGTALAFAFAVSDALLALPVFLALGLGLASPFLLIAFVPAASRWLPRPGPWMETLKQVLAFPMYATAIWLLWLLGSQRGADAMALAMLGALLLALGLWWYQKHRFGSAPQRIAAAIIIALSLAPLVLLDAQGSPAAAGLAKVPPGAERFTPERLAELRRQGRPVFVDVTADWCLTCKANELSVLRRGGFRRLLAETRTAYLVADYTRPDPAIAALLEAHGAVGIPLYLSYAADGQVSRLPNVLTLTSLSHAVKEAAGRRSRS